MINPDKYLKQEILALDLKLGKLQTACSPVYRTMQRREGDELGRKHMNFTIMITAKVAGYLTPAIFKLNWLMIPGIIVI